MIKSNALSYIESSWKELLLFWTKGGALPISTVEAHCDIIYALYLTGEVGSINGESANRFAEMIRNRNLPGWLPDRTEGISVHNTAYVFGAFNLLPEKTTLYDIALSNRQLNLNNIVNPDTFQPMFPRKWAHHNWRVSHWIGGIPSLLLSLARSGSSIAANFEPFISPVRKATNDLIVPETGLLKAYRSHLAQAIFRKFYAIRHNNDLGDLGGIAHILWFDHVLGHKYIGVENLYRKASTIFNHFSPFMETVPYCLDFDIVQIVRTAGEQLGRSDEINVKRARQMIIDIEAFFAAPKSDTYSLHKIPGALATWHECRIIVAQTQGDNSHNQNIDIIKKSYWL